MDKGILFNSANGYTDARKECSYDKAYSRIN